MLTSRYGRNIFLGMVAMILFPVAVFAEINIVSVGKLFKIETITYTKDGVLVIPDGSKRYKDSPMSYKTSDISTNRLYPGEEMIALSSPNSNKWYLINEMYYDENAIDLGDGRIIMVFLSGGNHCCSTFVSMLKGEKDGELKVVGSRTVNAPESFISRDDVKHLDADGSIIIEVSGFTDRYDDTIDNSHIIRTLFTSSRFSKMEISLLIKTSIHTMKKYQSYKMHYR